MAKVRAIEGWILITQDDCGFFEEQKTNGWYIAWLEVFTRRKTALEFAKKNGWHKPYKAVRAKLSVTTPHRRR